MEKTVHMVDILMKDLDDIRELKSVLEWHLENSNEGTIEEFINRFKFFSLKAETLLEQHHSDAQNKINQLNKISYVPNFYDQHLNFAQHFSEVEENYRRFLRSLKYENYANNSTGSLPDEKSHAVQQEGMAKDKIFIVHGHDDALKNEIARFIEKQGIDAIILHEQIDASETIIEKIEKHSDVGFAIVLYTPCDVGRSSREGEENNKHRARQNVVFEHGYFMAKLGRKNVLALKKEDVDIPNDLSGTIYTVYDALGAWKLRLAKTLENTGYEINYQVIQ